jgi:hypothetical protein
MTLKRRIAALECAHKQKHASPRLEVIRPGNGWVYLYWGNQLVKVLSEVLYDAT